MRLEGEGAVFFTPYVARTCSTWACVTATPRGASSPVRTVFSGESNPAQNSANYAAVRLS